MKQTNRRLLVFLIITGAIIASGSWFIVVHRSDVPVQLPIPTVATVAPQAIAPSPPASLDLTLAPGTASLSPPASLPAQKQLPDMFAPAAQQPDRVSVGGHLILDDKPREKDTPLLDMVKGAEVRVDVKTE